MLAQHIFGLFMVRRMNALRKPEGEACVREWRQRILGIFDVFIIETRASRICRDLIHHLLFTVT